MKWPALVAPGILVLFSVGVVIHRVATNGDWGVAVALSLMALATFSWANTARVAFKQRDEAWEMMRRGWDFDRLGLKFRQLRWVAGDHSQKEWQQFLEERRRRP